MQERDKNSEIKERTIVNICSYRISTSRDSTATSENDIHLALMYESELIVILVFSSYFDPFF